MISIKQENDRFIVEFNKKDVSNEFLLKLIRKNAVDQTLKNNKMSENDAWKLSEDIKNDWFEYNKSWIYEKIGVEN